MERLFFLIISLLFLTFLLSIAVGDVRELFNHHELEHINENSNHLTNYDDVERDMDELYSSLEDCGTNKIYNFEKPSFQKQLEDALNRVKYVNDDLNKEEQKRIIPDTNNINYINKINSVSYNRPNVKEKEQNYDDEISDFVSKKLHTRVNGQKMSNNLKNGFKRVNNNSFRPRKKYFSGDKIGNHLINNYDSDNNNYNFESKYYNNYNNGGLMKNNQVNKHGDVLVKKSNDVSDNELMENYLINREQNNKSSRYCNDLKDEFLTKNNKLNKNYESIIDKAGVENHLVNFDYQNNKIKYDNDKNRKGYFSANKNGDYITVKSKESFNREVLEGNVKNSNNQNNRSKYEDDIPMKNNLNTNKNFNSVIGKTDDLSNDVEIENVLTNSDQNNNSKYDNYKNEFSVRNNHYLNRSGNAVDEKLNRYSNRENDFHNLVNADGVLHASLKKNRKHYFKNKLLNEKLDDNRYKQNVHKINTDIDGYLDNEDENNFVMIDGMNFENNSSENGLKLKVNEEYIRDFSNNSFPEERIQYDKSDDKIEGRTRIKRKPDNDIKLLNSALNSNKANKVSDTHNNGYFHTTGDKFGRNNDDDKLNVQSTISPYLMDSSKSEFFPYSSAFLALPTFFGKNRVSINVKRLNNGIVSAPMGACPILRMTTPSISVTNVNDSELDFVVKLNKTGTDSEELRIAHEVSNFVANMLYNAGRMGNMRQELGLCKTYDRRYPFHVNKQVDDQLLAGLMNCISSIMEESVSNQKCSEMPSELKDFVDWLLLNGSSAHDQYRQFLSVKGCQQKSFLFPPNNVKLATASSSMVKSHQIVATSTLAVRQRQENSNKSPKIMDSLKKYIDYPSDIFSEQNNFQHLQDKNPYGLFKRYLTDKKISPSGNNDQNLCQNPLLYNHIKYNGNDNNDGINNWRSKNQIIDGLNIDNNGKYDNDDPFVGPPNKNYLSNYNYENRLDINKEFKKESDDLLEFETPIAYGNRNEQEPYVAELINWGENILF